MSRASRSVWLNPGMLVLAGLVAAQLLVRPAWAQFSRFQNYADQKGLGDLNVTSIAQDPDGYMLFGTQGGLYRYNGQVVALVDGSSGLPEGAWIQKVLCDADGRTWVMTTAGLYVRQKGAFRQVDFGGSPSRLEGPHLLAVTGATVVVDIAGQLRRATVGGDHVGPFSPVFGPRADPKTPPPPWTAKAAFVAADRDGGVLFGCRTALCRLSADGRPAVMGADMGLPADEWQSALRAADGTLWVRSLLRIAWLRPGDTRFGVAAIPGGHNAFSGQANLVDLLDDTKGGVLTQGEDGYLQRDATGWHAYTHHVDGLPDATILAMQFSRDGSLWLGSLGNGAFRSQGLGHWEHWGRDDGLVAPAIWSIARLPDGHLWVATDRGSAPLDRSFPVIPNKNYVLAVTRRGRLWTAPIGAPLTRFDPARRGLDHLASIGRVDAAAVDPDNRLWLATRETVFMLPDADADLSSAHLQRIGALSNALGFTADDSGAIWMASSDGVFSWTPDGGLSRALPPEAVSGAPFHAAFTPTGELWLATDTAGILRFARSGSVFKPLPPINSPELASNDVMLLHRDRRGRMWIGTDRGLDMFDGHAWQRFTGAQGLISNDLSENAVFEDRDGSLWFGTSHGLSHLFDTDHLPPSTVPRPPLITGLFLGATRIATHSPIVVPWVQGPLEIHFDDLNFSSGESMRFRYRLEGVDGSWNETDGRIIRYSAPPPGKLVFSLVAVDPIHRTVSAATTLQIRILAPWWQRPLFRWSLAALLAVLLFWVCRLRLRVLLRRQAREASYRQSVREQQRLEEMVGVRTAEIGAARDLLQQQAAELQRFALSDMLTGLPNRRAILLALERMMAEARDAAQPLTVLLLDIDHFKSINDGFGHQAGDRVLALFGERLGGVIAADECAGRYGGEEFLVVLRTDPDRLPPRLDQIRAAVTGSTYLLDAVRQKVTASGGVALMRATDSAATLIARADLALYQAKQNGRDRIELEQDETVASREANLRNDLRAAPRRGEFALHFQPVIDITRDVVTSCEALLRWESPARGRVPPGEFIPFAEQNGLMGEIGAWVLRTACAEAAGWRNPVRVSVNLSPSQFRQLGLVELISDVLAETGLPPDRLELEVTETAMIADVAAAAALLGALRALGISIALDDFGTGYSSLSFLRTLPFDRVKIDRSFVRDLGIKPEAAAIIGGVIHLCTGMGAAVTAEGVETTQQVELLRAIGCREVQGFGIGFPSPAAQIRVWLDARAAGSSAPDASDRLPSCRTQHETTFAL